MAWWQARRTLRGDGCHFFDTDDGNGLAGSD
jgi:hypothetical protein